jgi:hypothetical protein
MVTNLKNPKTKAIAVKKNRNIDITNMGASPHVWMELIRE